MIPRTDTPCQIDSGINTDNTNNPVVGTSHSQIPVIASSANNLSWQQELAQSTLSIEQLLHYLEIPLDGIDFYILNSSQIPTNFPLRATKSFLEKIKKGDINDPLLRQILPLTSELVKAHGYNNDPLNEQQYNQTAGLIQKYHGRALLIAAKACAIHCRYCFRRHFPYDDNLPNKSGWQKVFQSLADDPSIKEVIYSGGDPLAANDKHLAWLTTSIASIPHIKRLRIHSRLPVVLPSRINSTMLHWLNDWQGQRIVVIHCNHPNELDEKVATALKQLSANGVTLLNQAVLLKGVNDSASTLCQLSEELFDMGVMPYYLHLLDAVQGAQHFAVSKSDAQKLLATVSTLLPGFLVPKLVEEIAGKPAKSPINIQL